MVITFKYPVDYHNILGVASVKLPVIQVLACTECAHCRGEVIFLMHCILLHFVLNLCSHQHV